MSARTIMMGRLMRRYRSSHAALAGASSREDLAPARVLSMRFVGAYVVTMRPYLLFVSGITGIAGMALAPPVASVPALALATAFLMSYGFGQALTDCSQLDTDRLSAPYRPLVRGAIRRRDVMAVSLAGLSAIGIGLAACHLINVPLAGLAVFGVATYTPLKRRWWAGPFYNAWIVSLVALLGYTSGVGLAGGATTVSSAALLALLTAVFFGYANFVLAGYFKDLSADRATGYRTLPVVFGFARSAWVSDAFAVLAVAAAGAAVSLVAPREPTGIRALASLAPFVAGVAASVLAQLRLHRVRDERYAYRAIAPVVHAYVLLLSAITLAAKPAWWPWLAAFYTAFQLVLRGRPMDEQI